MANDELNVPSLVVVLVVSGLLIRHFFFRGSGSPAAEASSRAAGTGQTREQRRTEALNRRFEDAVDQIQQIFPGVDRRDVWWELRRNGLNIAIAAERITTSGLDTPPPPPVRAAPTATTGNSAGTAAASGSSAGSKSNQPSLIQRYRLEGQVSAKELQDAASASASASSSGASSPGPASGGKTKSWSSNRDERQALLKKRRDDMILAARRNMEAKLAAEKAAGGQGASSS